MTAREYAETALAWESSPQNQHGTPTSHGNLARAVVGTLDQLDRYETVYGGMRQMRYIINDIRQVIEGALGG